MNQEIHNHFKQDEEFQKNILLQIKDINLNLNNHIVHIASNIASIKTDIEWLKGNHFINSKNSEDGKQNTAIEWNTYFIRGFITAIISAMVAIITATILK